MVAERGDQGLHLVGIDEAGDRRFELVRAAEGKTRDQDPAISPDGRWVAFASSRGRDFSETRLWIAPLQPDAIARPLTSGAGIDAHPRWRPDGSGIVFDSTRAAGNFDLFELAIDRAGRARGEPRALTSAPGHEVTASIARDGTIVYTAVTALDRGKVETHLELRRPDGTIERLTDGPGDASPAFSPDGSQIAFARPVLHDGTLDSELWLMPRTHGDPEVLVDVRVTDEAGPVWSHDGRFVFATSVLHGSRGDPLFSSVVVVDLTQHPRVARILQDRTGAIVRITPAVAPIALDARTLDADPEYLPELARITAKAAAAPPTP